MLMLLIGAKATPFFYNILLKLIPIINFNSYQQATDEKVVKVAFKNTIYGSLWIESFNNRFKRFGTKLIPLTQRLQLFLCFLNFIHPHTGLNQLTPAQVAGN